MKVLVTGATGFVGGAVVGRLEAEGASTVAAVREDARVGSAQTIAVGDIGPLTDWSVALAGVERVVHLAARAHVMRDRAADPFAEFRRVNVEGTLNLARNAARAGVRRFVFISSVKVNGEATKSVCPFRADDVPAPEDPYGVSKWEAEQGLRDLARGTGMEVVIIRPPLAYGPGVKGNFASLIRWVERGIPLPFGAVRDNRRSLVALDNLVDLIVTCIDHPAAANEIFLAGDGEDLSTAELLERVAAVMGRPARLFRVRVGVLRTAATVLGRAEVARRLLDSLQVDISKTRNLLGWRPPVSLEEGLRRMVAGSSGGVHS